MTTASAPAAPPAPPAAPTTPVRLPLPGHLNNIGTVVSAVRVPDSAGVYPGYLVICRRTGGGAGGMAHGYSTNLAYTCDGGATWLATCGHYDLSFDQAHQDLIARVVRGG